MEKQRLKSSPLTTAEMRIIRILFEYLAYVDHNEAHTQRQSLLDNAKVSPDIRRA